MFSSIRKRINYTSVAITVAALFAMTGGAFAAGKYLITSTKQISPKVLKSLEGKTGQAGPAGLAGPTGPAGATGPAGPTGAGGPKGDTGEAGKESKQGETGKQGNPGTSVTSSTEPKGANCAEGGSKFVAANGTTYACNGAEGKQGPAGEPWTAGGVLPSGKSEYGVWNDWGDTENGKQDLVSISFTLPVEDSKGEAPQGEFVYANPKVAPTHCTGSASAPTAPPGFLCVYDAFEEEESATEVTTHIKEKGFVNPEEAFGVGVGKKGALLSLETVEIGKGGLPRTIATGAWAVTAK